jgi:hypothetical protein
MVHIRHVGGLVTVITTIAILVVMILEPAINAKVFNEASLCHFLFLPAPFFVRAHINVNHVRDMNQIVATLIFFFGGG